MSKLKSSNSSIDSGTFDVFDDPDDHFYDEPLLSTCDYHISEDKYRKSSSSSSSSSDVISISTHGSSSALESLLGGSSYKPLTNQDNSQQINSHFNQHIQAPSSSSSSNLICSTNKVINKPKLRPPKPPRHINPLTGKKLINSNNKILSSSTHLPLTLPPKGVRPLSTASSSSGVSSSGSLSPPPLTPVSSPSFKSIKDNLLQEPILSSSSPPPPLPPPSISKKPGRPPPPVPAHPPKPLRKKSEIEPVKHKAENNGSLIVNEVTISQLATIEPIENQESVTEKIDNKTTSPLTTMAVLNRSRSGSFYETAFDSKAILHGDSLHRDQINHISHHTSHHSRQPINQSTYHNQHHHHRSSASNSSVSSFIPDMGNSSQSSTASSTASSLTGHESSSSTPKHLDQLAKSLLPRRQGVKTTVHIPRSKSSDITLNLSAAASNSSSSSSPSPINQNDSSSSDNKNTSSTSTINQQPAEQSGKRHQRSKLSSLATFSMLKSATSDALSSLDFEAGRVLTRTRSNLDSLRLSIHERNGRINNYNLNKEGIGSCESIESNRNHASISNSRNNISKILTSNNLSSTNNNSNGNSLNNHININNKSSNQSSSLILNLNNNTININNNNTNNSSVNKVTDGDKLPANRSFRRLNLKLDETRSSINVPSPKLQSPLNDTRPLDDYDTPWDSNQRLNKVFNKLINTPTSEKFGTECFPNVNSAKVQTPSTESNPINTVSSVNNNINNNITTNTNNNSITNCDNVDNGTIKGDLNVKDTGDSCQRVDKIDELSLQLNQQRKGSNGSTHSSGSSFSSGECETNRPKTPCSLSPSEPIKSESKPERPRKLSLPLNLKNGYETGNSCHSSAPRANLNLDLCNSAADSSPLSPSVLKFGLGPRKKPLLTFTGQPLPVVSEDIDTSLVLEKQGWYHGSITRLDAENLLRNMKEGSYLIRNCESTKQDYSLSLKSVKGFMHMKIVKQSDGKFVLGVFSKPFSSIPEMVKHYSINKLPIRGAEHMSLLYPVIDNLL